MFNGRHVGGDGQTVVDVGAGAWVCCGLGVGVRSTVAVVGISEGPMWTFFIRIDNFDDNALRLLIPDGRCCHFCFAASRCLCCHVEYSPWVLELRTP